MEAQNTALPDGKTKAKHKNGLQETGNYCIIISATMKSALFFHVYGFNPGNF